MVVIHDGEIYFVTNLFSWNEKISLGQITLRNLQLGIVFSKKNGWQHYDKATKNNLLFNLFLIIKSRNKEHYKNGLD